MTRGSIPPFNLYEELEVSRQATPAVIEAAHRALVKRYHPDVAGDSGDAGDSERITRLNIARDWLLDPVRRARYDGRPTLPAAAGAPSEVSTAPPDSPAPPTVRRARRASTTDAARPARPSSSSSFGVNSREVRQFLAELRELDGARARRLVDARGAVDGAAYIAARDASLEASRPERAEAWGFARDAAAVIVKNKADDVPGSGIAASVAADIAGAIVVRDRISAAELERLREPWVRSATALSIEPARRQRAAPAASVARSAGPAVSGEGRGAAAALAPIAALARQPRAVGLVAAGLAVLLAVALFAGGRKPDSAVAGLTSGPTGAAYLPGASASAAPGSFLPDGSIEPLATSPAGETGAPASTSSPTPVVPGRTAPPVVATFAPTPRATASPKPTPAATATAAPTSTLTPTPEPTPVPPTATPPVICTVVDLAGTNTSNAQLAWNTAGFSGSVVFSPAPPPQYKIGWQSLTAGTDAPCASDITVQATAP